MRAINNNIKTTLLVYIILQAVSCRQIIDLSHELNATSLTWPSNPAFNFTILHRGPFRQNAWLENNYIGTAEHLGTHLDAPAHFAKGRWHVHEIPLHRLTGPGVVINVKDQVKKNSRHAVSVDDLKKYEKTHGRIPNGAVVIMNSGWASKWPNYELAFGSTNLQNWSTFRFPGWGADATQWLIKERAIHVLGTDCPSIDVGNSPNFPSHDIAAAANVAMLEHVDNLDKIPESGTTIFCPVIKIDDGSGGPLCLFALVEDNGVSGVQISSVMMIFIMFAAYLIY